MQQMIPFPPIHQKWDPDPTQRPAQAAPCSHADSCLQEQSFYCFHLCPLLLSPSSNLYFSVLRSSSKQKIFTTLHNHRTWNSTSAGIFSNWELWVQNRPPYFQPKGSSLPDQEMSGCRVVGVITRKPEQAKAINPLLSAWGGVRWSCLGVCCLQG